MDQTTSDESPSDSTAIPDSLLADYDLRQEKAIGLQVEHIQTGLDAGSRFQS